MPEINVTLREWQHRSDLCHLLNDPDNGPLFLKLGPSWIPSREMVNISYFQHK